MDRNIFIYGHGGDTFDSPEDFTDYIERGISEDCYNRYRYSQKKHADIVLMSLDGIIYGHFETDPVALAPTENDLEEWDRTVGVYIVQKSVVYPNPVSLAELGITAIRFGKRRTEKEFADTLKRAGISSAVQTAAR